MGTAKRKGRFPCFSSRSYLRIIVSSNIILSIAFNCRLETCPSSPWPPRPVLGFGFFLSRVPRTRETPSGPLCHIPNFVFCLLICSSHVPNIISFLYQPSPILFPFFLHFSFHLYNQKFFMLHSQRRTRKTFFSYFPCVRVCTLLVSSVNIHQFRTHIGALCSDTPVNEQMYVCVCVYVYIHVCVLACVFVCV